MARYPKQSFACSVCGAAQRDRFNLDRHWRRSHGEAAVAGGDVVVAVDGVQLRVGEQVSEALWATEREGTFALRWLREGGQRDWMPVVLGPALGPA